MTLTIEQIIARWDSGDGKPYKGELINMAAYEANPTDIGCMCAQGQVLHLLGGWDADKLRDIMQREADKATAKLLGISTTHAILLRQINDAVDGAPSIVLTAPEKVLGDQAHIVLAFWRHLDRMTNADWLKVAAAREAAREAARAAAGAAAWSARKAAREAAWAAAWDAEGEAARKAAREAAREAAWDAWDAWDAEGAANEIQGAAVMRGRGRAFFFLPMFGFADPEAVLAADIAA